MEQAQIAEAARLLAEARKTVTPLPELPADLRPETEAEAYQVQDALIALQKEPVAGWKIGCTNLAAQRMLKTEGPFSGRILATRVQESPAVIDAGAFNARGLEVEMAFRLGRDLPPAGAPYDRDTVAGAVAAFHPAVEIVDSRYVDWLRRGAPQLVADNGCHGAFVYGAPVTDWQTVDLAAHRVALVINGAETDEGFGRNVMGHPLEVLAWLANQRARHGDGLAAGQFISTGTCCPDLGWVGAGDQAVADFGDLGRVEIRFV